MTKKPSPWAGRLDKAWTELQVPLAFIHALELANRHPHDIALAQTLRVSAKAIEDARDCIAAAQDG